MDLTWIGHVACQTTILEGAVIKIGPGGARDRRSVRLKVSRWLKPADGAANATLDIRTLGTNKGNDLKVGGRYLLTVPKCSTAYADAWEGPEIAQIRRVVIEATPQSKAFEDRNAVCYSRHGLIPAAAGNSVGHTPTP